MLKRRLLLLAFTITAVLMAQENPLPVDFRSHNLTQFNSSLFHPASSLDKNKPRSVAIWSRWQWQSIDSDPTTLFINYTQMVGPNTAGGMAFFQHNTGLYLNTGVALNTAHAIPLGETSQLRFGGNLFVFGQEFADDNFISNMPMDSTLIDTNTAFLIRFSPGVFIQANDFSMGLVADNVIEANFSDAERESPPLVFTGIIGNDFPVFLFDQVSYFKPQAYIRAIQDADTQFGVRALFAHPKFWAQTGYNSFYGMALGAGVNLGPNVSLGGLMEFGLDDPAGNEDPSLEIVASYFFGKQTFAEKEEKKKQTVEERMEAAKERRRVEEEERERKAQERILAKQRKDSIKSAKAAQLLAAKEQSRLDKIARAQQQEQDSINNAREAQLSAAREQASVDSLAQVAQQRQDSINNVREAQLKAAREQARLDSIAKVEREKEVEVRPGEKYEEVATADGLQPGFYLIANVFGTKKYLDSFLQTLRAEGLEPDYFYRALNGYNYVYLKRYDAIEEARKARDSKFDGRYLEKLWIFRVRGQ